ncbi:MAG: hypothetical protein ACTHMC_08905 [Pseudobacter sp.]|uniref:hypothetical protein n=1 Tax=Pseudobacter sp. TaxID=2045420 RepID=UPI003F81CAED
MGILSKFKSLLKSKDEFINAPLVIPDAVYRNQFLNRREWMGQFVINEKTLFRITYYGQLHERHTNLITGTSFAPALLIATEPVSGIGFTLYDGCKHGYNALFAEEFTQEQVSNRPIDSIYKDEEGNDLFELHMKLKFNFKYDEEMGDDVDEDGMIELPDGRKLAFDAVKQDGFDSIIILGKNPSGKVRPILMEESA